MTKRQVLTLLGAIALLLIPVMGCGSPSSSTIGNLLAATTSASPGQPGGPSIFQNPFMAPNPDNNIHNDSYLSDSYLTPGPSSASNSTVTQVNLVHFNDPATGGPRILALGECAAQAYDSQGDLLTFTAGVPNPITNVQVQSVLALDPDTFEVLAFAEFDIPFNGNVNLTDFGGAGYFYEDNQGRMVVGTPSGHVQVLARQKSTVSSTDQYLPVQDYNVTGSGGPVTVTPQVLAATNTTSGTLYALLPDQAGNIWFTVGQGIAGFITPSGQVQSIDLNDPTASGTPTPQPDGNFQQIANSEPVDEGDGGGPSGVYVMTTYNQYRLQATSSGPQIVWQAAYDHGTQQKPGQVSFGSGTSPAIFNLGGRRFLAIADNGTPMQINVYRAEAQLQAGESRLFAQLAPFGNNTQVSDENALVVAPAPDSSYCDIFCENNWGYTGPSAVNGSATTMPGFARVRVTPDGNMAVGSLNSEISVPSIVSKVDLPSQTIYTYNKTPTGWFLTGLDALDLTNTRFSVAVGPGNDLFDNHYSSLSLSRNNSNTIFLGTLLGLTRVAITP